MDSPKEIAESFATQNALGYNGGMLVCNPIPDAYAMDYDTITNAINEAVSEAEHLGIKGKETTPYLLGKVKEITKGKSLDSNIQLVYNNATLAAKVACELNKGYL